jgi:nicotinamidase-related amidase
MVVGWNGKGPTRVVVDLNTQADFLTKTGAYPVVNTAELVSAVRHVVAWTKWHGVPVVSSLNTHRLGEIERDSPATCCIDGTPGQRKLVFTMMGTCIRVEGDNTLSVPMDLFDSFQQVIFRQRTRDLFANPKADRFLTQLPAHQFLIYGVAVETTVKALVLGLLARRRCVTVLRDACGYWNRTEAELAIRQMAAKGAQVMTVAELLSHEPPRKYRSRYAHYLHPEGNGHGNGNGNGNGKGNGNGHKKNGGNGRHGTHHP